MKRAFGVIELLIAFLLISIIVAGFMKATLVQMKDSSKNMQIQEVQQQADEMIDNIENIREQNLEYEKQLLEDDTTVDSQETVEPVTEENTEENTEQNTDQTIEESFEEPQEPQEAQPMPSAENLPNLEFE